MPSTEAKTHFGALLDKAQREPVRIEKKGRPVAVIMSENEYQIYEDLKLASLQQDLMAGIEQANKNQLISADDAFKGLV